MNPLEQFEITPFMVFGPFTITNFLFIVLLLSGFFGFCAALQATQRFLPSAWVSFGEDLYLSVYWVVQANLPGVGSFFLPLLLTLFGVLLGSNVFGLIPYSFTLTSHLIITFSLAFFLFVGLNSLGIRKHRHQFWTLCLPSGTDFKLIPLLVPIELISYVFRVISLPVRLFANMMAGHTLLKVIAGFAWSMMLLPGVAGVFYLVPLLLLVLLMGLEFGVALIQAYVFLILTCIYLHDAWYLH